MYVCVRVCVCVCVCICVCMYIFIISSHLQSRLNKLGQCCGLFNNNLLTNVLIVISCFAFAAEECVTWCTDELYLQIVRLAERLLL